MSGTVECERIEEARLLAHHPHAAESGHKYDLGRNSQKSC